MKSLLFVDDNEVLTRLACDILALEGYYAVPAYNGRTALEIFERQSFDLIITDLCMDGMDGLELAAAIHERNPEVPVIMVTGYGPVTGEKERHLSACLPKEELFPGLLEVVQRCLEEAEAKTHDKRHAQR